MSRNRSMLYNFFSLPRLHKIEPEEGSFTVRDALSHLLPLRVLSLFVHVAGVAPRCLSTGTYSPMRTISAVKLEQFACWQHF